MVFLSIWLICKRSHKAGQFHSNTKEPVYSGSLNFYLTSGLVCANLYMDDYFEHSHHGNTPIFFDCKVSLN